jgi:hypothetical protein
MKITHFKDKDGIGQLIDNRKNTNSPTQKDEKLYRVECVCAECGTFLMGSNEKPHMTREELSQAWTGMVLSAPLNAPRCPKCHYSTEIDCNAHTNFLIDDGKKKVTSKKFFKE